jgi:hypothetical protein
MPMLIRGMEVSDKDLNQRFADNYIEIKHPNSKVPEVIHVGEFSGSKLFWNDGVHLCKDIQITREFPELGAIEFDRTVHYLSRLPRRQWTRGFNRGVITDFCRGTSTRFSQKLDLERARAVFNPHYTKLEEGLLRIGSGDIVAFAYNPRFWFSGNKKRAYLWFEDVPVGEVTGGAIFFNEQCLSLKQEVKDEFKNVLHTFD